MKRIILYLTLFFALLGAEEIENVQFSDLNGKSYDLYEVLDRGTYVYIFIVSSG